MTYGYNPQLGRLYALTFALYENVPAPQRLFYYDADEDCTNFISQCVWAGYGGWVPGFTAAAVAKNASRIRADVRQTKGVWYGSASNIGSNRWCRVEDFYAYVTDGKKTFGPAARKLSQGGWGEIDPSSLAVGDVVQMVVASYAPGRFGHGLYVTRPGQSWDDVLICCHTEDRLEEAMGWFAQFPEIYRTLRVLRFSDAAFES